MSDLMPTRGRIMALLSPPSQDVYLDVEDARWIKAEIERLERSVRVRDARLVTARAEIERLTAEVREAFDYGWLDGRSGRDEGGRWLHDSYDEAWDTYSSQCEHVFPPIKFGTPPRTCLLCGEPFTPSSPEGDDE